MPEDPSATPDQGPAHEDDDVNLDHIQAVIKAFARHYAFLHEKRIHKLLFAAEWASLESRGHPLLGVPFKRYYYGVYSDLVHLALSQDKELQTAADIAPDGRPTVVFIPGDDADGLSLDPDDLRIIEETHAWTKKMSTEDLAWFGKSTEAWEATEFDQEIDMAKLTAQPGFITSPDEFASLLALKRSIQAGHGVRTYNSPEELLADLA